MEHFNLRLRRRSLERAGGIRKQGIRHGVVRLSAIAEKGCGRRKECDVRQLHRVQCAQDVFEAAHLGRENPAKFCLCLVVSEFVGKDAGAMHRLGWSDSNAMAAPLAKSFANALYDKGLFQQTPGATPGTGKVWPHRPDTFILIAPGKDGLYGTGDDLKNF